MTTMSAFIVNKWYIWSKLKLRDVNIPPIKENEVLIRIDARGVNEEDLEYKNFEGLNGISACPGLECAGTISEIGSNVTGWKVGDKVCALLRCGGYAEMAVVPSNQLFEVPPSFPLYVAAGIPYTACMLWLALFEEQESLEIMGKSILIRDGASAMGVMAIHVAKHNNMEVIATEGTSDRMQFCSYNGAHYCINHTKDDFVKQVMKATNDTGVDIVLDGGVSRIKENLACCSIRGKVLVVGLKGKEKNNVNLALLMVRHLQIKVIDLGQKDDTYRARVVDEVRRNLWPQFGEDGIRPIIDREMLFREAEQAHEIMKKKNMGKIILCNMKPLSK